ncbi:hypothetical protein KSS87_003505 [Heliosperma pusillum]|nr:hypothetical protein KSS87_003505 [Heliosperma pusillum]
MSTIEEKKQTHQPKLVVLADLNVDPPEFDDDDSTLFLPSAPPPPSLPLPLLQRFPVNDSSLEKLPLIVKEGSEAIEGESKRLNKLGKCRPKSGKVEDHIDCGADVDGDQHSLGTTSSREEKVSSLKTAVLAYEKAAEILLRSDEEIDRPELLSLVQMHHAQCLLLENMSESTSDTELDVEELEEILSKLKESVLSDIRQVPVWSTLGMILLKTGRLQSAISVLSSLSTLAPDNLDCLGNLGLAYLQSGNLEAALKCFQGLILKDQAHPSALVNYAAILLCKYSSPVAGAGASAGDLGVESDSAVAISTAKECLLAALKLDPKAAHVWANLASAYNIIGDYKSASKCLEKAVKLEPNCMSTRYSVAVHRIKDAERSQNPSEQLSWAGNEMGSILREADPVSIDSTIAWAGLAMVHQTQHEISAAFESEQKELMEVEEHALYSLKQVIGEDPDDPVHWHQLGLHSLRAQQFKSSQNYLKAAVSRFRDCSYVWSNLGISLQLSGKASLAEDVFKRALSLATSEQQHAVFSNLGNLYRQEKKYDSAKAMFSKALKLKPGYAPAYNNLGLVFVAEGLLEEAKYCFDKALQADPLLDAAKSNLIKVGSLCKICKVVSPSLIKD